LKHGDFSQLAADFARHRAGYSESVRTALLSLAGRPVGEIDVVDVGAGTGIWTRMVAGCRPRTLTAVEPNEQMRSQGEAASHSFPIRWLAGRAERLPLPPASCDMVTMASSLHWVVFDDGVREFHRILRDGGRFAALWNTRSMEANPLLVEIEERVATILSGRPRVSSGRSEFTEALTARLYASGLFTDVVYLEGRHVERMAPERYVGLWRSVNDVRVQAGEARFAEFIRWVEGRVAGLDGIDAADLTRAWSARRA